MAEQNILKGADKAVAGAVGMAGRRAMQVVGNAIAPIIGGVVGGAIGDKLGRGIYRLVQGVGAFLVAQAVAGFVAVVVAAAILVVFAAFAMFIINSGAYMVPPGPGIDRGASTFGGDAPLSMECPSGGPQGWPVTTGQGQRYYISQGPFAPSGYTHYGREAIDLSLIGSITLNHTVIATHPGTVSSAGKDSWGGLYVDIRGECDNGVRFRTRHVHFTSIDESILTVDPITGATSFNRVEVARGAVLGIIGDTGYSTGVHDHYEIRHVEAYGSGPFANSPFRMEPPFIPVNIPRGCQIDPPCSVYIP